MANIENNFNIDNDKAWLFDEAKFYYFSICLFLFFFQFHILTILYFFFGLTLIWEDFEDERTEADLLSLNDKLDFYSQFGFLVHWETLIDHLDSISLDPVVNNDIIFLKDFFFSLDKVIEDNNIFFDNNNLMLMDFDNKNNNLLFLKNKMIKLSFLNDNSNEFNKKNLNKIKKKFKNKFSDLDKKVLFKGDLLKDNYEYNSFHNKFLVGNYLNNGLFPYSDYDCEKVLIKGNSFSFSEYSLFEYSYLNNQKWLDSFLIESENFDKYWFKVI